ncbi:MAG: hypothetical protein RL263_202 [Bacteroidota bacterium]|jgi:uncharacterized protein involved in exopolysaccharide biosynthesis
MNDNLINENEVKPITLVSVVNFFWRWRKVFIISASIAAVMAIVMTHPAITKPKYKAQHIFYPTKNNSISNALLTELNQRQQDPLEFGEEIEAEKALQIIQSGTLIGRLVKNFNLMEHYGIDPKKEKFPKYALDNKIQENFNFERTRYLSIKIEVLDEDPKMAAALANGIALLYDSIKTEVQNQVAKPALDIVGRALAEKRSKIQKIKDDLRELGTRGITNYEEQSRALAEEIYKAQSSGKTGQLQQLLTEQKALVASGGDFIALNELIKLEEEKESNLITQFEKRQVDVGERLSHKFTVEEATVPEIKFWPKRSFIFIISVLGTIIATAVVLVCFELFWKK